MSIPEIVFPASRLKAALLFLGSIAFVALSIWLIRNGHPIVGWAGAGFFGLGVPVSILMLRPNTMYLRLTPEGFEMHSPLRTTFIRWSEVERFELRSISGAPAIAIVHNDRYTELKTLRAVVSLVAGAESAVPNHYRASRAEVFAALNEWHSRHRQQEA